MKTWIQVQRRLDRMRKPYRVQDETLVTSDGRPVAYTVQGARDFLASPGHPDSNRQKRCKQLDLTRYGARMLKESGIIVPPKKERLRDIRRRLQVEKKQLAASVAARLLGGKKRDD